MNVWAIVFSSWLALVGSGGYLRLAYVHGWPSLIESKHERALAEIDLLEHELGIAESKSPYVSRYFVTPHPSVELYRNPYAFLDSPKQTPAVEKPKVNGRPDQHMPAGRPAGEY